MHTDILSTVVLPIALAIIMLGLGLHLTVADFRRAATARKAVLIALACQILVMPAVCVVLLTVVNAPPTLAVGMLLLAASPGGTLAALYSHLAKGDVALNITLTAVNSLLAVVTLPLAVWAATAYYVGDGQYIGVQPGTLLTLGAVVLAPVVLGMLVRHFRPNLATALHRPVRIISAVGLTAAIVGALVRNAPLLGDALTLTIPVAATFSILNLLLGYWMAQLARLKRPQAVAISIEIGIHNSALAMTVAVNLLNSPEMAIAPAIYALVSLIVTAFAALLLARTASADRHTVNRPQ
nr:bile acid:sodium symporter family protein [Kibdelosporangium sp. MJ126-NF4]CEL19910.1 Sodium-dependent transporter [Kibdelosporangium sp. MJ126-NF4]CTQ97134.1 Sodium-dependent transporter [Kibdelosporangium sp. MJ126-NF4]